MIGWIIELARRRHKDATERMLCRVFAANRTQELGNYTAPAMAGRNSRSSFRFFSPLKRVQ